ncbi:hypothetical protein KFK09_001656 [Dendrobium nobile]|uniref:CCHC-type domain-containing protein n=1 Tax=Dendrobium nobile TaxID=94219 RepID=A0A8T3CA64_DENNO|nr:hypothetical protein KFK09_001656 [Dendrobium nobile]
MEFFEDGVAVKLNAEREADNSKVLKNSIVLKVLGNGVPFSVCCSELRRQWSHYGKFHLTSIGLDWILCSFNSSEVVDEVLNEGPWYVKGLIVGIDRWTPAFDPNSFKGISGPVWIRLPCLPLYCWDEDSIARIASCFGSPMYVDGNTFWWSKREFARVCVRIDLEKKLLNGTWVEGSAGRFFQRVEYEKIDLMCYQCGRVGHDKKTCPENVTLVMKDQSLKNSGSDKGQDKLGGHDIKHSTDTERKPEHTNPDDQQVAQSEEIQLKAMIDCNVNEASGVCKKDAENDICAQSTNRFAILDEEEEGEILGDVVNKVQMVDKCLEPLDPEVNLIAMNSSTDCVKVKLAKELKSLGPVDSDYQTKKKRNGRLNPNSGGRSSIPF